MAERKTNRRGNYTMLTGFSIVGTLPKAFRHKRLGYVDAYVMYQLLQDPDHWPTADE